MKHKVLVASDQMRLCNVMEAVRDLEEIFSVCDMKETGEGAFNGVGILSPMDYSSDETKIYLDEYDTDKIERMRDLLQVVYAKRGKWVLA